MRIHLLTGLLLVSCCGVGTALAQSQSLPDSTPTTIGAAEAVCTGAGADARADARWRGYPVRLEFSGEHGQYLGDATVKLTGENVNVTVHCSGPWLLLKLPAGRYQVSADVADAGHKELTLRAPMRAAVTFPMAGGKLSGPASRGTPRELAATKDLNGKTLQLQAEYDALGTQYKAQVSASDALRQAYSSQLDTHNALNRQLQNWNPANKQQYEDQQKAYLLKETPYEEQARLRQQQHADYQSQLTRYETQLRGSR